MKTNLMSIAFSISLQVSRNASQLDVAALQTCIRP